MEMFTTGDVAKACDVTVRTIQYYDKKGIVKPSELSDGGRRLYTKSDIELVKKVCFFKEIGISLGEIKKILSEENSDDIIRLILSERKLSIEKEIEEKTDDLKTISELLKLGDGSETLGLSIKKGGKKNMDDKKKLKIVRLTMLLTAIPVLALEVAGIILWVKLGIWWVFLLWGVTAIPWGIIISKFYFESVNYACPNCRKVFKPKFKDAFWAYHTPTTRKLVCPHCGKKSFCVETCREVGEEIKG